MIYKRDRYLVLDPCGNYLVRIAIPKYMRHLFGGRHSYVKSTGTRDVREARLFRDAVALEWIKIRSQLKPERDRGSKVEQILNELRRIGTYAHEAPEPLSAPVMSCPSLLRMRDQYILQFSEKRKLTTLSKTNKAVEVLLEHLKKRDVQLRDINRTTVTGWLDKLKTEKAPQENIWRGHGLESKSSKVSYEVFEPGELAKVFAVMADDEEMQNVTLIGMYSGMRLNEICSLCSSNIKEIEGVLCFEVTEGKSKSAARIIPVHSLITPLVLSLREKPHNGFLFYRASIIDRADGKRSTWHSQRFTRAKRKALGEVGSERKVFHSLRHQVAQLMDRGGIGRRLKPVPEDRVALLLGHERGNTESFKTYSKNAASPVELRQYIELLRYPEIENQ
ncbi:tyrosine-type recombinase/integrase [Escherichia coli]|nr:tyrosine-type recombinase/integrase [Escherichia coli]